MENCEFKKISNNFQVLKIEYGTFVKILNSLFE
jgi:hypothetical protein